MDKIILTPKNSNIDSIMEKFRIEIESAVDEDRSNNRRITISSPIKYHSNHSCDIDSQIKELEETIEKLQNEITDLNKSADNYVPKGYDFHKKSYIIDENKESNIKVQNISNEENKDVIKSEIEQCNHLFPLFISEVSLPLDDERKLEDSFVSELLSVEVDNGHNHEHIDGAKEEVLNLWNDSKDYTPKSNLDELINELQTEISEKLENLNDVDLDELCNSSKEPE